MNQNQPQISPQSIYPNPQSQQNDQPTKEIPKPQKDNTTKIIIIILGCFFGIILIIGITYAVISIKISSTRSKLMEAKIKECVNINKLSAQTYYNQKNTYIGWIANESCNSEIKTYTWYGHSCVGSSCDQSLPKYNSGIKVQNLTSKNYLIYAYLPYSDMQYCTDSSGFMGEVINISPVQTNCK